jgi:hypothetical protein
MSGLWAILGHVAHQSLQQVFYFSVLSKPLGLGEADARLIDRKAGHGKGL